MEASYWSRSLESDATVRADYALTTTTTTTTLSFPANCDIPRRNSVERLVLFAVSPLPLHESGTAISGRLDAGTLGPEQPVEPGEVRLEVGERALVVHRVLDGPAPERHPAVRQARQVVAGVRVGADPVVEHHRRPARERVGAEQHRRDGTEHAEADELPRVVVLRHPDVHQRVAVVHRVQVPVSRTATQTVVHGVGSTHGLDWVGLG